jgi:uncharacterized protein YggE
MNKFFFFIILGFSNLAISSSDLEKSINVVGKCEQKIMPDRVKINATVEVLNKSQLESTKVANTKYNKLLSTYKELKLKNSEFKTTEYKVFPHKVWEKKKQVFKGYKTRIGLSVSTSEIKKIGKLLNVGNKVGHDFLNGPTQYISDSLRKKIQFNCLAKAIDDAKNKASIIAKAAGIRLGKVISVSELNYSNPRPMPIHKSAMRMESLSSSSQPNIELKSSKISLSLNVFFAIK